MAWHGSIMHQPASGSHHSQQYYEAPAIFCWLVFQEVGTVCLGWLLIWCVVTIRGFYYFLVIFLLGAGRSFRTYKRLGTTGCWSIYWKSAEITGVLFPVCHLQKPHLIIMPKQYCLPEQSYDGSRVEVKFFINIVILFCFVLHLLWCSICLGDMMGKEKVTSLAGTLSFKIYWIARTCLALPWWFRKFKCHRYCVVWMSKSMRSSLKSEQQQQQQQNETSKTNKQNAVRDNTLLLARDRCHTIQ